MDAKEKIGLLDTAENRDKVINGIVNEIFNKYKLNDEFLKTWLYDNMEHDTLYDLINNEQKLYVVRLAEKCAADICFVTNGFDGDFSAAMVSFGEIGAFVLDVISDNDIVIDVFADKCKQVASVIGYEDTLVVDDTAYVFDNGSEGNRICYKATFKIDYHKNYTCDNLRKRIVRRFRHDWKSCDVRLVEVVCNDDKTFTATATFLTDISDVNVISDMIGYRFGANSGKPWYRIHNTELVKL